MAGLNKTEIGDRLRLVREALGMSQVDFAARAGIAANTYNQIERGVRLPSVESSIALCEAHDLTLDWIFRGDVSGLKVRLADSIKAMRKLRSGSPREA